MKTIVISMLMVMAGGSLANACSAWVPNNSTCGYGDMETGAKWKRECPDTVCQRSGHNQPIHPLPCDNEKICMPRSPMDGPRIPGGDVPQVEIDPNNLETVCQLWYPVTSVDAGRAGCSTKKDEHGRSEIIWVRECQMFGGTRTLPTKTCSIGYPNESLDQ